MQGCLDEGSRFLAPHDESLLLKYIQVNWRWLNQEAVNKFPCHQASFLQVSLRLL